MSNDMKITNFFKEKQKTNKRCNMKNSDGIDIDELKFKEIDSHFFKNKKIKFQYPKPKGGKTLKTLSILKSKEKKGSSNDIDSKSTQAFSKKIGNLLEEPLSPSTTTQTDESKDITSYSPLEFNGIIKGFSKLCCTLFTIIFEIFFL